MENIHVSIQMLVYWSLNDVLLETKKSKGQLLCSANTEFLSVSSICSFSTVFFLCKLLFCASESLVATGEFVEELFIQCVALLSCASGHEDVSSDVLVHNLTVCVHTAECYVNVSIEFNRHLE